MKGDIKSMTALPNPIYGKDRNGQLVSILALGDVEGHSPSCWFVNTKGSLGIESVKDFTVLDPRFLPNASAIELLATNIQHVRT